MEGKKGFIITIVVLSLLILGMGAFIVLDFIHDKKQEEIKTTIIKDTEIDLNTFYSIADTLNSFDKAFNNPKSLYIGYIYVPKKLTAAKFDMGAAVFASIINDMSVASHPNPLFVAETKVKYNFEKIFGKKLEYKPVEVQSGEIYKVAYYSNEQDTPVRYDYYAPVEESPFRERYIAINYKTSLDINKVIVSRRIFYAEFVAEADGKTYNTLNLYKKHDKKDLIGTVTLKNGFINEKELLSKFSSKMMKYNYVFSTENGTDYTFDYIEVTK